MKRKFDLVVSIGYRCFTSMMLRQNNLQVASFPFDWLAYIKYKQALEFLTNDFKNFLNKEDLELCTESFDIFHYSYLNKRTGIMFVHDFPVNEDFDKQFEIVSAKYKKRSSRLLEKILKSKKVLLVFQSEKTTNLQNIHQIIAETEEMIPLLKEKFPNTEFHFMHISFSKESNGFYHYNKDINLEIFTEKIIEKHRKIKFWGITFSLKNNNAPDSLKNCCLNKSLKDKFDNAMYWMGKIGLQLVPSKKVRSFFEERKY